MYPMPTAVPATVPACALLSLTICSPSPCNDHVRGNKSIKNAPKIHPRRLSGGRHSACKNCLKTHRNTRRNAAHFFLNLVVRAGMSTLPKFRQQIGRFFGNLGGHVGDFGCPDPHLDPKRAQGPTKTRFYRFSDETVVPFGGLLGTFSALLFCSSLRDTKKGGLGRPSKLDPFFWSILVSARRASGGFPSRRQLNFHFAAGPKRAPKWEPKWSLLGSQIRTILTLGHHLGEIGTQKAASKNECRIWWVRGGGEIPPSSWAPGRG